MVKWIFSIISHHHWDHIVRGEKGVVKEFYRALQIFGSKGIGQRQAQVFSISLSMTRGKAQQESLLNCFTLYFNNLTYKCQDTACQWAIQRTLVSCKVERDLSITLPFNLQVSEMTLSSLPYPAYQEGINRRGQYILYLSALKLL